MAGSWKTVVLTLFCACAANADVAYTPIDANTVRKTVTDIKTIDKNQLLSRRQELVDSKIYWTKIYTDQMAEFDQEIANIDAALTQFPK